MSVSKVAHETETVRSIASGAGNYLDNYTFWDVAGSGRVRLQDILRSLGEVLHSGKSISVKRVRSVDM